MPSIEANKARRYLATAAGGVVLMLIAQAAPAATRYFDSTAGAGNGVGGSATFSKSSNGDKDFSTTAAGDATLTTAATTDDVIFAAPAGTVTFSADYTFKSATFTASGYTLATTASQTLTTPITLGNSVNLNLAPLVNTSFTLGSITGGTTSTLTLGGATTSATDAVRINLASGAIVDASTPISIATTGTSGLSGFVSANATATINAAIVNNAGVTTMLGATSGHTLNVGGVVSGSAGVQYSAGTSGGAGTINLNAAGQYLGTTIFNGTASTGVVKLGVDNGISTASAVVMEYTSGNGQGFDLNGHNQSFATLSSNSGGTGGITNSASSGTGTLILNDNGKGLSGSFGLIIGDGSRAKTALTLASTETGKLALTGSNTYTGATTVDGGTLVMNGSLAGGTAVSVGDGANAHSGTLAGGTSTTAGNLSNNVTINTGGAITAGSGANTVANGAAGDDTVGKLASAGTVTLAGGTYLAKVNSGSVSGTAAAPAAGDASADQLILSGLSVSSPSQVALSGLGAGVTFTQAGSEVVIASLQNVAKGTIASLLNALTLTTRNVSVPTGTKLTLAEEYLGGAAATGTDDLVIQETTAAPEPTSVLLLAAATAPVVLQRRRRGSAIKTICF